jgi:hypothetical protein
MTCFLLLVKTASASFTVKAPADGVIPVPNTGSNGTVEMV